MRSVNKRFTAIIALFVLLIGILTPNVLHAQTTSTIFAQVKLTTEEADTLFEASLIYEDVTYYGVRESADSWRFMIDAERVDSAMIETVTLYNEEHVPYSFTAFTITDELAAETILPSEPESAVSEDASEPVTDALETEDSVDVTTEQTTEIENTLEQATAEVEAMMEEVAATTVAPAVTIDKLVLGADGPITQVLSGDLVTYRLVIEVAGTPIDNFSVSDTVPEALTVVADSVEVLGPEGSVKPTVVSGPPAFYWTFPTIPVGTTTIQFDAFAPDVDTDTDVTNTFCIGVEGPEEAIPAACDDVTVTVVPNAAIGLEVGKEANIDQAVVGGRIPYTFVIENTGDTNLTITSIEDEFFSGGIQDDAITVFNEEVRNTLMALIGDDGLAAGERVETTVILDVPSDYDQVMHPEIGNIFRVAATDEYGRVVDAESQQIVLLNRLDFTVTKVASPQTVHPGETILYTYTITNTSNVTLYFVDVMEEWTSGALTAKEQRETTETLRDGMRALAEVENGLIPGEEVVLELEKVLLPSYDVRAGGILTNRVTFTFEVNNQARVSRSAETTVHVKQAIPEREDDEAVYVPEPTTPVSPEQGTLPMTGTTETWGTVIGLILIMLGLLFFTHRRRPSSKM